MKIIIECECGNKLELKPDVDYALKMNANDIIDVWTEWTEINIDCNKCGKHARFDVNGY